MALHQPEATKKVMVQGIPVQVWNRIKAEAAIRGIQVSELVAEIFKKHVDKVVL